VYTRKGFLILAGKRSFAFVRKCLSLSFPFEDQPNKDSDSCKDETLFLEAMRVGIDPATMDKGKVLQAVKAAKRDKNQEGGMHD